MSSDMRTALLDALGRCDVPPGPEKTNFTIAFAAGWNAAANPEARADSAVPSSHVSDQPSALSDRAALVDRCVPPLPNPEHTRDDCDGMHGWWKERTGGFTAEQMEEHAKAALAAFADLLGIMIASATQIVDGDVVVGYEIKTGALHRMLGMFGGTVHIPLGLPSREAVCAEPAPTTASAPANSETDVLWVHDFGGPTETIHNERQPFGEESEWTEFRRAPSNESILREALARLYAVLSKAGGPRVHIDPIPDWQEFFKAMEAARSALAGIPLNASGDPTERLPLEIGDPRDEDDWYYLKRDALQWADALRKILPLHFMDCNVLDDLEAFLRRVAAPRGTTER